MMKNKNNYKKQYIQTLKVIIDMATNPNDMKADIIALSKDTLLKLKNK